MNPYFIFEAFQDVIFIVDETGKLFFGNGAAAIILETSPKRLTSGRSLSQFISFDSDPILTGKKPFSEIVETTQTVEISFNLPSGKSGWVQAVIQPEPEVLFASRAKEHAAASPRWIISMRDVTLEKNLHVKYRKELDNKEVVIRDLQEARAKLEEYSHGLEGKVQERTAELSETNSLLKAILDSLGQGILVFDKDGNCLPIYSQVCKKLLNGEPPGRAIEDVIGFGMKQSADFRSWRAIVFEGLLDFDDLAPLAPSGIKNHAGLEIALNYNPMIGADKQLHGIVVAATDKTLEMVALRKAEVERQLVSKVTQVARNRPAFRLFVSDARRRLLALGSAAALGLDEIARDLHTLKGGASSFALQELANACHELETALHDANLNSRASIDQKLKRSAPELTALLERELSELSEILGSLASSGKNSTVDLSLDKVLDWGSKIISANDLKTAREIGRSIIRECTEKPIATSVAHLESSLKELAVSYGKKLEVFKIEGGDTVVDSEFFEPLLSSLIHSFRNSVYHGLETADERRSVGKTDGGSIVVRFSKSKVKTENGSSEADWLTIEIQDDGRGVDPARVRKKLISMGRNDLAMGSDESVTQAILLDDFSTAEQVDMVAGRGVGMAAIAGEVKRVSGSIIIHSKLGQGMRLSIQVPIPAADLDQVERKLKAV